MALLLLKGPPSAVSPLQGGSEPLTIPFGDVSRGLSNLGVIIPCEAQTAGSLTMGTAPSPRSAPSAGRSGGARTAAPLRPGPVQGPEPARPRGAAE